MYGWLSREIAEIKTRGFHVVEGPMADHSVQELARRGPALPRSYGQYILRFGNSRLYRLGSYYLVGVRFPEEAWWNKAQGTAFEEGPTEKLWRIGHYDDSPAYFRDALMVEGMETPIYELSDEGGMRFIANDFGEWLHARCRDARERFGTRWRVIRNGPPPFTPNEKAIVEARNRMRWRLVGVTAGGDLRFEVSNESSRVLPYLSIGVRSRDGRLGGKIWLPIGAVGPGEKVEIEKGCYKNLVPAEDLEVFALPDPDPGERDQYWEFRKVP